jgi:hypothetical protein
MSALAGEICGLSLQEPVVECPKRQRVGDYVRELHAAYFAVTVGPEGAR